MTPDGHGAHPGAHVHVSTVSTHAPADAIVIHDAHLLFTGDFKREGVDLVVSGDNREIVLHDYFKGEKRAALASPDGAHLTGDLVNALTGHTQFAQADGSASVAQVIGHVTKLTGTATAIRNGVSIILNQGDNVNKGDVVASGSDSTLGITFIDGTVFGLASNAKMVLNEMIYDPNGSDNKSLISLVQGTISFVAGATAKHGDMKVDTPVATMGIRGTAVLVEIDFEVSVQGGAPPAKFQVLVEPDGTTGSYILFDKTTLTPIATVNQAGTQTIVNGQGTVNFLSSAQLSADAQKIITDVFALKFSDLNNPNTKTATNFTDSITQQNITLKTASGEDVVVKVLTVNVADKSVDPSKSANPSSRDHIPGPPTVVTHDGATTELAVTTGSTAIDSVTGTVAYADINPGDVPTVTTKFTSYTYQNAGHTDVTATLTAAQLAAIKAVETPLVVVQDPTNINHGVANWTYNIADSAFDFLAAGEVLTLTYTAHVDNDFALNNEFQEVTFTITITGTNDKPVITSGPQHISFVGGKTTPGGPLTTSDATSGTLSFTDVDLTDTHTVSTKLTSALLSGAEISTLAPAPLKIFETALTASIAAGNDSTQKNTGTINWKLADLAAYLADFVPAGDTLTLVYTVTVTDSQGATSTQDITVTITGNNTPAVVWIATTASGSTGDWNDAANWETGTVPTGTDDAIIITNQLQNLTPYYPVTINAAAFAKTVTLNDFGTTPPELDNNSTLQIGGAFDLFADSIVKNTGTISVGGAIEVQGTSQLTNSGTLNLAQGGDFKDSSSITNSGTLDVTGGALNVLVNVTNASGALKVEHGAALNLKSANINGGTVTNAGTLDSVSGNNVISGFVTDTGTIEVVSGTLNLSGGLTGVGTLIVDGGTTLELAGADAQTVTFAGGTGILQLNNSLGFTGTISGVSSSAGAFTVTGAGNVTSGGGDAIDFTASGGTAGNPATVTLTPSGTLTGAAGGIKVVQNGVGDISVNATGDVAGLAGNGIVAQDSATGTGNIVVHSTGSVTGTGSGSVGVVAVNFNAANSGNVTVTELGGVSGGGFGIDAETHGNGDVSVEAAGSVTAGVQYGIVAKSFGAGDLSVVTDAGTTINSGGTGIIALNRDTAIDASANSTVTVTANGTINSGTTVNLGGSTPSGIAAGYTGIGGFGAVANTSVNGTVVVNNYANITAAAGYGIDTYNYGNGDVTVNDKAGTSVTGAQYGIAAYGLSGGTGNVTVNVEANATITGTSLDGIHAFNYDNGNVTVATSSNDAINAGNIGINAVNRSAVVSAGSSVAVTANGTINAGSEGIVAGYDRGTNSVEANVAGDVTVNSSATIVATGFNGIVALNWGTGDATVTSTGSVTAGFVGIEADAFGGGDVTVTNSGTVISTGTASGGGIRAEAANGGNVSVTNDGSVSGATAIWVGATGASDVSVTNNSKVTGTAFTGIDVYSTNSTGPTTITNNATVSGPTGISVNASGTGDVFVVNSLNGQVTGTTGSGIYVSQVDANPIAATGSTTITNSGTVLGSVTAAAIAIQENAIGTATIVNHGTIGPGVVTASTQAVSESGGDITINNDGFLYGTLNLANGTLNNTGTWQVGGSSGFGFASSTGVAAAFAINNTGGAIDLIGSAHLYGANGLDISNSGTIEGVSGTNTISGAAIDNSGAVKIDDGVAATLTDPAVTNTLKLDNGTRIAGGTLTIGNLGVLEIEAGSNLLGATLDQVGISGAGGLIDVGLAAAATLTLTNGANANGVAVTVESGSTLNLNGGAAIDGGIVTNSGTIEIAGAASLLNDTLTNTSATGSIVQVDDGQTLTLSGTGITSGTINISSPSGTGGTIDVTGASTITDAILNNGHIRIENGVALTLNNDSVTGTSIEVDGGANPFGNLILTNGTTVGGTQITIDTADQLTLDGATIAGGTVTNNGKIDVTHDSTINGGASVGNYDLVVENGATLTLNGAGISGGAVTNDGTIDTVAAATLTNVGLSNAGTIEAISGTLTITGSVMGGGSIQVDAGAFLELNATVAATQKVVFAGAGSSEVQLDASTFGGQIQGMGFTDEIDLRTIGYGLGTTGTYVGNASGGVLTITDGIHSISMTLVGDYLNAHFVGATDGSGGTLVTLNAVDDKPTFTAGETTQAGAVYELANTTGSSALDPAPALTGTVHFADIDMVDRPTATMVQTVTWADHAVNLTASLTQPEINALEQAFSLQQSGNTNNGAIGWTYGVSDSALDFLAAGQTATVTSTITLDDHEGKNDTATVTITIHGANDVAAITATTDGSDTRAVTEDGTLTASGALTVADADHGENHFQTPRELALAGTYGSFSFDAGTGAWSYALNNAASNVQALTGTDVVHDTLTVTSADSTDSHVIDVTIHGTNDPATITATTEGSDTGAVTEDGTLSASGALTVADVDHGENHFQTPSAQALTGTYGSFSFDAGTGAWSYALNNTASNVQALTGTDVVHDTLTATSADGTDSHFIDVTINGTNDPATITATTDGSDAGAVTEDGTLSASGALTVADVDHGENHFQTPSAQALTGTYGSFSFDAGTGAWSYALNNAASNVQALTGTGVMHDTLTVKSADGTDSHVIDVTIHGTNDAPVAGDFSISNAAPSGDGWILDTDNGHYYRLVTTNVSWSSANAAAQGDGAYLATVTSQAEQDFVATLATGNRAWLGGGATDDDTGAGHFNWLTGPEAGSAFDYTHWRAGEPNGGFGATEYVHIEGVDDSPNGGWNDAPDAAGGRDFIEEWGGQAGQVAFREDTGTTLTTAQLLAHATDVDSTLTVASVSATSAHGGAVSLDGNIVTYHPAADYNGADSFTYTVSDGSLTSTATVSFNVAAVNDAPVFTGDAAGTAYAANGDAVAIATHVAASDVDSANYNDGTLTATVIAGGQQGDTLSIASGDFISVRGNEIWFDADGDGDDDAVDIGALTNNGINSLTITLNSGADDAAVAALTQAIEFSNSKPDPVAGTRTVAFTLHDGGGIANGGHDSAYFTANVDVTAATAPEFQLLDASFLGGAGDQAATAVTYNGGHLYLTYNAPITSSTSDHSTVVGFTTGSGAPTQNFSDSWSYGFFTGVAADANTIYAAGGSHPSAGLTRDGVGGEEEKSILVGFNADGTAGSSHAPPATEYAANNFFSYTGTEMFQGVLATTQGGNTILYATGFGQPASYGAYVLAEYNSAGTLLHSATDPGSMPGFSNAYAAVEFNGAIWAVGNTQHSGDVTNTATVWTASYDLSSVVTHKDVTGSASGNFTGAAVIGNALYAVGNVNSNGGDFLIAKYNTDGSVAWSESFGGSGADTLNGAVALDGHLYVVGSTTSGGNTDGVLMEINTADGSVVSSTTYGGALYDSFNAITTDGHNLYVAGESKSFTNGGNAAGQDDAILLTYSPGHGTAPGSSGLVIDTDQFSVTPNGDNTTTVSGLVVTDTNADATLSASMTTGAAPESHVTSSSATGFTYDPGTNQPDTDSVTYTVTDSFGATDTVHFIFNQGGTGPDITLTGTSGKDVIFATGNNDTLTGGAGADQFVFRPGSNPNSDTITDFSPGLDHIDLRAFSGTVDSSNLSTWLASAAHVSPTNSADVLITLDGNDAVTLKNVALNNLHVGDFIVSPHA